MKKLLTGLVAVLVGCAFATSAFAFGSVMCAPDITGGVQGPRTFYNNSVVASVPPLIGQSAQNPYIANSAGCAYIYGADIPFALSQGWTIGSQTGTITFGPTGVQTGTTSLQVGTLPANTYIVSIGVTNLTANAITGGLTFSSLTGGGGTAFVTGTAVAASTSIVVPPTNAIVPSVAPTAAPYTTPGSGVFVNAVTAWNNANVAITIQYAYF